MYTYRVLRGSGTGMVGEQEEDRADRELGEVDVIPLDEADLLRHFGQLEPWVALGPNSIEKFWLEHWLEKSVEFWLEIPHSRKMYKNR